MISIRKVLGISLVATVIIICGQAWAADMSKSDTSPQDVLSKIHTINQEEISMGKMALQKGQSSEVKDFAHRMITDHTAADQKVMDLAKKENLTLSVYPPSASDQAKMEQLKMASGGEFDRLYMEMNRKGHDKAIAMLKDSEKQVSDPQVKALVGQLLPKVEHHDRLAKQIQPSAKTGT